MKAVILGVTLTACLLAATVFMRMRLAKPSEPTEPTPAASASGTASAAKVAQVPEVPFLRKNPYYPTIKQCMKESANWDFPKCRATAAAVLPKVEAAGEKQSAELTDFPRGAQKPRTDMEAAALLLWCQGDACFQEGDNVAAKPVLEKLWRKYPYVRTRYPDNFNWMPASDAFIEWQAITWEEAIEKGDVTKIPFAPELGIYDLSEGGENKWDINAVGAATRAVFYLRGPKPMEAAMDQMMASEDYQTPGTSKYIAQVVESLAKPGLASRPIEWEGRRKQLEQWEADEPQSTLVKLALVRFWVNYAWQARGSGYANTVTNEGEKLFEERLGIGLAIEQKTPINHPMWYVNGMVLGLGLGADRGAEESLFKQGIEKFPWFYSIYSQMQYYLLPRWYGGQGDWEAFSKGVGRKDPELYVNLCRSAAHFEGEDAVTKNPMVDWALLRKGYEAKLKRGRGAWPLANEYAQQACRHGDKEAAREAFSLPEARYHPLYWTGKENYQQWRKWAGAL